MKINYKRLCCNHQTIKQKPPGTYEICSCCHWEDDFVQYHNPDLAGGPNIMSLNQAKQHYIAKLKTSFYGKLQLYFVIHKPKFGALILTFSVIGLSKIFSSFPVDEHSTAYKVGLGTAAALQIIIGYIGLRWMPPKF